MGSMTMAMGASMMDVPVVRGRLNRVFQARMGAGESGCARMECKPVIPAWNGGIGATHLVKARWCPSQNDAMAWITTVMARVTKIVRARVAKCASVALGF